MSKLLFNPMLSVSTVEDFSVRGEMEFPVRGWNHPVNFENYVKEHFKTESDYDVEIISRTETAFYTTRFFDGVDAKDEGFSHWVEFVDAWKPGYGKCTIYTLRKVKS